MRVLVVTEGKFHNPVSKQIYVTFLSIFFIYYYPDSKKRKKKRKKAACLPKSNTERSKREDRRNVF